MSRVAIKRVQPAGLHGYSLGKLGLDDLQPGLNVVYAPNAFGKSTLAKAIGLLFNPADCDYGVVIHGDVVAGETLHQIAAVRKGPKFDHYSGRASDYQLHLVELLAGLRAEDVAAIDKLIGTGNNLAPIKPTKPTGEINGTIDLRRQLLDARREKNGLSTLEDRLPVLAEAVEKARNGAKLVRQLETAIEWKKRKARTIELREAIDALAAEFPGIEGQSASAVPDAKERIKAVHTAREELRTVRERMQGLEAPQVVLAEVDDRELTRLTSEWLAARERISQSEREKQGAQAKANKAREAVFAFLQTDPDHLPTITAADIKELDDALANYDAAHGRRLEAKASFAAADSLTSLGPFDRQFDDAVRLLVEWLKTEPTVELSKPPIWPFAIAAVLALAAAIPDSLPIRVVLAVAALAVGGYGAFGQRVTQTVTPRPTLPTLPQGFKSPEPSVPQVVEELLRVLRSQAASSVYRHLETKAGDGATEPDWTAISASQKLRSDNPLLIGPIVRSLEAYQIALGALSEAAADLESAADDRTKIARQTADIMRRYRYQATEADLSSQVQAFRSWFANGTHLAAAEKRLDQAQEQLKTVFDRNGVTAWDSADEALDLLTVRQVPSKELHEMSAELNSLTRGLAEPPELGGQNIEEIDPDQLQADLDRQSELAEGLEAALREQENARLKIQNGENDAVIAGKEQRYHEAFQSLEVKFRAHALAAVKGVIHRYVQDRIQRESLPQVIAKAGEYLGRFSHGRYRLETTLDKSKELGGLVVRDSDDGQVRRFTELSTGTKVHTILAVKMAQLDEQERGTNFKFPLLADEALAVSDADASRQVATALVSLCSERQVIVFTNQKADVTLFKELDPTVKLIMLGSIAEPDSPEVDMPDVSLAPKADRFDPRIPISAHAVGAVLPNPDRTVAAKRIDQVRMAEPVREFIRCLDLARAALNQRFPRLRWADIENEKWAQTQAAPQLMVRLEEVAGCPYRFMDSLANMKREFNKDRQDQLATWLDKNLFLPGEPELRDIAECVDRIFADDLDPSHKAHAVKVLTQSFVPRPTDTLF